MYLDFMTSDVWDALVIGVVLIGLSLAVLRIISDRTVYQRLQRRKTQKPPDSSTHDQL
jgi:hypothetical protein